MGVTETSLDVTHFICVAIGIMKVVAMHSMGVIETILDVTYFICVAIGIMIVVAMIGFTVYAAIEFMGIVLHAAYPELF